MNTPAPILATNEVADNINARCLYTVRAIDSVLGTELCLSCYINSNVPSGRSDTEFNIVVDHCLVRGLLCDSYFCTKCFKGLTLNTPASGCLICLNKFAAFSYNLSLRQMSIIKINFKYDIINDTVMIDIPATDQNIDTALNN